MSDEEPSDAAACLHKQQLDREPIFPLRPKPDKPEIQDREIGRLHDLAFGISFQLDKWDQRKICQNIQKNLCRSLDNVDRLCFYKDLQIGI